VGLRAHSSVLNWLVPGGETVEKMLVVKGSKIYLTSWTYRSVMTSRFAFPKRTMYQ